MQEDTKICYECPNEIKIVELDNKKWSYTASMLAVHVKGGLILAKILCNTCWNMKLKMGGFLDIMLAKDMPITDAINYLEKAGFKAFYFPINDLKALKQQNLVQFTYSSEEWDSI